MTNCLIHGCRNLETRCKNCGRLISTAEDITPRGHLWRNLEEIPPEDLDEIHLITDGKSIFIRGTFEKPFLFHAFGPNKLISELKWTHWMPLPKPPGYQDDSHNDNQDDR